jgi:histidinol-phosphate aminotransferase
MGIQFVPSFANFVLVEFGRDAEPISEELLSRGVIVRPMRWMGLPTAIRVSVGTHEENETFLKALDAARTAEPHPPKAEVAQFLEGDARNI